MLWTALRNVAVLFPGTVGDIGLLSAGGLLRRNGSPWENGYNESFNGKLRDELLNCEIFDTLLEAKVLIERWRRHYNTIRPHSALGYRSPAPEAFLSCPPASATLRLASSSALEIDQNLN